MDGLVRVRLVRVSHPNTSSSVRRLIYTALEKGAVETPFGWIVLSEATWRRLLELNERAKREVGTDVVHYVDVYVPRDVVLRWLEHAYPRVARNRALARFISELLEGLRKGLVVAVP